MRSVLSDRLARVAPWHIAAAYVVIALVVSVQKYLTGAYNNYLVFTGSLKVMLAHQPLYAPHPDLYWDLFKYSPTFPLFMAPVVWLPVLPGLIVWNLVNALALYAAVSRLWSEPRRVVVAATLIGIELVGSLQHTQSNALVAALIIFAFVHVEHERPWKAAFYITAGFFLKGYGAVAGLLALVHRSRWRVIAACAVWFAGLALLPLAVLSPGELLQAYRDWLSVSGTFTVMRNSSVMRVFAQYVDPTVSPRLVQALGAALFALPLVRLSAWTDARFRLRLLCSLLVAIVIFNNSAEPPTYVIALSGCCIWYASSSFQSRIDRYAMLALLMAILLVSTDVYPRSMRAFAGPWTVKTMGCLVVWLRINWELLTADYRTASSSEPVAVSPA